jgi:hypothetical protein
MVAIIVEGKRDVTFFRNYITHHLKIEKKLYKITKTDGKSILLDKLYYKYKELKEDLEVGRVHKVLFIIDSDNNRDNPDIGGYNNSCTAIEQLIKDLNIVEYADFFIACDPITQEGNIENLVISTLTEEQNRCIKSFLECSGLENDDGKRLLGIYNYGYPEEPFDFSHKNFDELKIKLTNLFKS